MKKVLLVLAMIAFTFSMNAQMTVSKAEKPIIEDKPEKLYDSLTNGLSKKDMKLYTGQEFYIIPQSEGLREYGYSDIYTDPEMTYSKTAKYDEIAGKLFDVEEVIEEDLSGEWKDFKIILSRKEDQKKYYLSVSSKYMSSGFDRYVLVNGFIQKTKERFFGKEYILGAHPEDTFVDIKTGELADISSGLIWKIVDFTLDEKYFSPSFVLENKYGQQILRYSDQFEQGNEERAFLKNYHWPLELYNIYKTKFGGANWEKILKRKVWVGMTKEMLLISWGEPESISSSSYGDNQWVYNSQYVYLNSSGIVTAWN